MTDPPPDYPPPYGQAWQSGQYGYPPPYGQAWQSGPYGCPPPYGQYYYQPGYGTPGRIRPTGFSILLFICTLGIYYYIYNYQVHDEMKRYSGRGIGGGIALLLTFLAGIAMPFVTPAEVGSLYSLRGQEPPVTGWTGLWQVLPMIVGYFGFLIAILSLAAFSDSSGHVSGGGVAGGLGLLMLFGATIVAGMVTWFVKTNTALNDFWASLGVTAEPAVLPRQLHDIRRAGAV